MNFQRGNTYHIYNRSNNKQLLFYSDRNYLFFLDKIRKYIIPHCSLLAYCLMPNHFHLLIYTDKRSEVLLNNNSKITTNVLSEGIRLLLSSYSKGINKQEGKAGNLFQQKTKAKLINGENIRLGNPNEGGSSIEQICFDYIHLNPVKAGLVMNPGEWKYSSYNEFSGAETLSYCDKEKALNLDLDVPHL